MTRGRKPSRRFDYDAHTIAFDPKQGEYVYMPQHHWTTPVVHDHADEPCTTDEPHPDYPCRHDGRCQYAIDSGAEGMGHCPRGKCVMDAI